MYDAETKQWHRSFQEMGEDILRNRTGRKQAVTDTTTLADCTPALLAAILSTLHTMKTEDDVSAGMIEGTLWVKNSRRIKIAFTTEGYCDLSSRARGVLRDSGLSYVDEINLEDLKNLRNCGPSTIAEVTKWVAETMGRGLCTN